MQSPVRIRRRADDAGGVRRFHIERGRLAARLPEHTDRLPRCAADADRVSPGAEHTDTHGRIGLGILRVDKRDVVRAGPAVNAMGLCRDT